MKKLMMVRSETAVAGLAFVLGAAVWGRAAVIHVPADYPTIQSAVDAAQNHDTIRIAAGVYTNQVEIANKDLTLSGSSGAVLRATPGMHLSFVPELGAGAYAVSLLGIFQSDVVVSGMTFEGQRLGDSQPGPFFGIWFFAAGGRVEDCRITGIRSEALANGGEALKVENPLGFGPAVNVDVLWNTFADNGHSIRLTGDEPDDGLHPELLRTTFTVNDNIIVGNGPDNTGVQYGIIIWVGAGGEVKRNLITDHACTGGSAVPFSYGIVALDAADYQLGLPLAALQPVRYEGNVFLNNQVHMALARGDGSMIVNNSFGGTGPGYRPTGLYLSGEDVKVVANRFDNMETGIVLFGLDPDFGPVFGIASNAKVVGNQFCEVPDPIVIEPLATGTQEQGNQLDACH